MDELITTADRLARRFRSKAVDDYLDRKAKALGRRVLRLRPDRVFRDFRRVQLDEIAEAIGFTTEDLSTFAFAAEQSGASIEDLETREVWVGPTDPEEADRSSDESD